MFFNVLPFALGALTLVHAAPPAQVPLVSCNVNLSTSPTGVDSAFLGISPGKYAIVNSATGTLLHSDELDQPVFVAAGTPGPFAVWEIEPELGWFKISNLDLDAPTFVGSNDEIISGKEKEPVRFNIFRKDFDVYTISAGHENQGHIVWTVEDVNSECSNVKLAPWRGMEEQLWKFVKIYY